MKFFALPISFALPVLILSGCASSPEYQAASTETARLRVALIDGGVSKLTPNITSETMVVEIYDEGECENEKQFGFLHSPNYKKDRKYVGKLNMPLGEYGKSAVHEDLIEANKPVRVAVNIGILNGSPLFGKVEECDISLTYEFEEGVDYEFVGAMKGFDVCTVDLNKLVNVNNETTRQTIKTLNAVDHPIPDACLVAKDEK